MSAETYKSIAAPEGVRMIPDGVYDNRQDGYREDYRGGKINKWCSADFLIGNHFVPQDPWGHYPDVPRSERVEQNLHSETVKESKREERTVCTTREMDCPRCGGFGFLTHNESTTAHPDITTSVCVDCNGMGLIRMIEPAKPAPAAPFAPFVGPFRWQWNCVVDSRDIPIAQLTMNTRIDDRDRIGNAVASAMNKESK